MINALRCIFFSLIIVHKGSRAVPDDDFRPTPIPLDKWHTRHEESSGTLQEIVKTDHPAPVVTIPPHYWEDALRHSVYLTLVRDKIDELIAKGTVQSENSKAEPLTKEDDDRDMWEKIKNAPFDRLVQETTTPLGDISILAKGRLLEQNDGYKFAEDETARPKCVDEKCMQGVKAFWSVKRVRQRDAETQPGKHHYELTFSVTSQTLQKEKNPNNKPVRTFTVRESPPRDTERIRDPINNGHRPQRAVWVHKNIVPTKYHDSHPRSHGLDRFFSSLFSDEDAFDTPKYKQPNVYVPQQFPQLSKVGNVGTFGDQRKLIPYPYKPQPYKHLRQPIPTQPPPIVQPYIDFDGKFNNPYSFPHGDHKILPSNIIKTTRPAFLPTPIMPVMPASVLNKVNLSTDSIINFNITETITKEPQFGTTYKNYNKPKPTPVKVSYFTEYVRPPVFNAPPGVFVTMDKKPFKPMPPLKFMHNSKSKPIDFRPSPQLSEGQFSDPDSFSDSAFRPITLGYTDNTTVKSDIIDSNKKRKLSTSSKKPPKVVTNIKPQRTTTTAPEIITAHGDSFEEDYSTEWVHLLGAFSKTTPMASQKTKSNATENAVSTSTTPIPTTLAMKSEVRPLSTTEKVTTTVVISTKRTRPPPKFTKPNKIKKHKRVTTSTTTKAPQNATVKTTTQDLTPQASSATKNDKFNWKPKNETLSTTPVLTLLNATTTTTSQPTTMRQSTTTAQTTSTTLTSTIRTTTDVKLPATTQPKHKNRYRQSTLMYKGTSVKHDRWSGPPVTEKHKPTLTYKPSRRNESNFQGYSTTTLKTLDVEHNKDDGQHLPSLPQIAHNSSEKITTDIESTSLVQSEYENSVDQYATSSEGPITLKENDTEDVKENQLKDNSEHDIKDQNEYIFNLTSTSDEKRNDVDDNVITTDQIIITTPQTVAKNKTRCKKRKNVNTTTIVTKIQNNSQPEVTTTISKTTTENSFSSGFFDELLRSFNTDTTVDAQPKPQPIATVKEESGSFERFTNTDNYFDGFLDSLEDDHKHDNEKIEEIYEDDVKDASFEHTPFNSDEENHAARASNDEYNDYQEHPYTLFELMAME